jgi:S1-C subfamily serine protease
MKKVVYLFLVIYASLAIAVDNPYAVESSIYKIDVQRGNKISSGTGFLISHDKILTNCHVLDGKGKPDITLTNRKTGTQYYALRYYNLGPYDACVLIGGFGGKPLSFTTDFRIGQNVWHYGYPHGVTTVGQGTIVALSKSDTQGDVIKSSSFCNPGSSGGPLINNSSQIIGLIFAKPKAYGDNKCLSIPSEKLLLYLNH